MTLGRTKAVGSKTYMVRDRESGQVMLNECPLSPGPCRSQGQALFLYHSFLPVPFLFLLTPPVCPNSHCLFIPRSCVLSAPCCQLTSITLILAHFFLKEESKLVKLTTDVDSRWFLALHGGKPLKQDGKR